MHDAVTPTIVGLPSLKNWHRRPHCLQYRTVFTAPHSTILCRRIDAVGAGMRIGRVFMRRQAALRLHKRSALILGISFLCIALAKSSTESFVSASQRHRFNTANSGRFRPFIAGRQTQQTAILFRNGWSRAASSRIRTPPEPRRTQPAVPPTPPARRRN